MNNCSIFFGKVVSVDDSDKKLYRIRATIAGYTEQIAEEDLPFYYPFYGVRNLPLKGDTVPIFIFNMNFSTGMYGRKQDAAAYDGEDGDYPNYLEVFKRTVSDKNVELSYSESLGVNFINGKGKVNIQDTEASMNVSDNQIHMTDSRIDLGTNGQATVLGDDNVKALKNALNEISTLRKTCFQLFNVIKTASTSGFLAPIRIALTAAIPVAEAPLPPQEQKDMKYLDTIQSAKNFFE
jgi:hypothetical protein